MYILHNLPSYPNIALHKLNRKPIVQIKHEAVASHKGDSTTGLGKTFAIRVEMPFGEGQYLLVEIKKVANPVCQIDPRVNTPITSIEAWEGKSKSPSQATISGLLEKHVKSSTNEPMIRNIGWKPGLAPRGQERGHLRVMLRVGAAGLTWGLSFPEILAEKNNHHIAAVVGCRSNLNTPWNRMKLAIQPLAKMSKHLSKHGW